jgi:hypothetical protein
MSFVAIDSGKLRISAAGWFGSFVIGYADTAYAGATDGLAIYSEVVDIQGREWIALRRPVASIVETRALTDLRPLGVKGGSPVIQAGTVDLADGNKAFSLSIGLDGQIEASDKGWLGSVALEYDTAARQSWEISGLKAGTYSLMARSSKTSVPVPLTVSAPKAPPSGERSVIIDVRGYCTDAAVAGATVYVDGTPCGATDADGLIIVNNLAAGSHTLRVTASGFIDSDQDDLVNDQFTV